MLRKLTLSLVACLSLLLFGVSSMASASELSFDADPVTFAVRDVTDGFTLETLDQGSGEFTPVSIEAVNLIGETRLAHLADAFREPTSDCRVCHAVESYRTLKVPWRSRHFE